MVKIVKATKRDLNSFDIKSHFFTLSFLLFLFHLFACTNGNSTKPKKIRAIPEVKSTFINGDSIHYIDIGKGDPVVFVHGLFADYRTWEAQIDTFAQNHRVISYSRRLSYPNNQVDTDSTDVSYAAHAKDLAELLKALNLGPVHLVGHSVGGTITLLTTIEHPELVRSLVLAEADVESLVKNVPDADSVLNSLYTTTIGPATEAFKSNNDKTGVSTFVNGVIGDSLYFNNLSQQNQDIMLANAAETKHILLYGSPSPQVSCNDLNKIKVPVLLLTGEKSISFFSLISEELYRCLNSKEKATIMNATHGLEFENSSEFNRIVLEFIDRHL